MENMTVQTAVCKSLQSLGLSPRKEHQIENAVANQIRSSGPEYLLGRLSDLSDWRKMHMRGDTEYHPDWHAYKSFHGAKVPADPIGSQVWPLSDKAFFAVVGSLRKSVELAIPSEKQLTKWIEGVRCENRSSEEDLGIQASFRILDEMESKLKKSWTGRHWFDVTDVTGTSIPGSGKEIKVRCDKKTLTKEPLSLLSAYEFSVSTAPLFVWQFLKDIDAPKLLADGVDCPDELIDSLNTIIQHKLNDFRLIDEAERGSSLLDDELYLASREYLNSSFGFAHSVGNIGFLEQEGGKLRTVANPNRLVQYINRPLGDVMSMLWYNGDGSYVRDQEGGMTWAQEKLREGISLSSFDMSSATDRLDYRKFLHEYFRKAYEDPDRYPLLVRSLELFEDTSSSNWSLPGHVADLCNMPCTEIGWTVGQPLGLRPSFPLLQGMNKNFAKRAIFEVDGVYSPGHFACVGDDLIIETRYAKAYMDKVTMFNGKINNEKTIVSDRYAEFCSQMITRSNRYPLKPRFITELEGSLQNVEKFSTSGLQPRVPRWTIELHDSIAKHHLEGYNTLRYSCCATPKSLIERIGVNELIEAINPASREPERVSLQTLYLRALEERDRGKTVSVDVLSSSYADSAYKKFGGTSHNPTVNSRKSKLHYDFDPKTIGNVSTDKSTSVELPIKKEWDFREAAYKRPVSEMSQAKSVAKTLQRIETSTDGSLVESRIRQRGIETSVLVDVKSSTPDVLISHRPVTSSGNSPQSTQVIYSKELSELMRKYPAMFADDDERSDDDDFDLSY